MRFQGFYLIIKKTLFRFEQFSIEFKFMIRLESEEYVSIFIWDSIAPGFPAALLQKSISVFVFYWPQFPTPSIANV